MISNFFRRLKVVSDPFASRRLVGEDKLGNKYFEVMVSSGTLAFARWSRGTDQLDRLPAKTHRGAKSKRRSFRL